MVFIVETTRSDAHVISNNPINESPLSHTHRFFLVVLQVFGGRLRCIFSRPLISSHCLFSVIIPYLARIVYGFIEVGGIPHDLGKSRLCSCVMYFLNLHQSLWFMDGFNSTTVSLRSRKHTSALVLLRGKTFIQISFNMFWTYWLRPQGGELSTKSNVRRRTLHWSQLLTHVMQIKS